MKYGATNDVMKDFSSTNHHQAMVTKSTSSKLSQFGFGVSIVAKRAKERQDQIHQQNQKAETLFLQSVADHNLPFRTGDHFTLSAIAKEIQCSRTKTSVLARYGCRTEAKDLVILVRLYDPVLMKAVTRFLALPTANDGRAIAIFEKIKECFCVQWYRL